MTENEFKGKCALVTGGSRGIGKEIALTLGRYGAKVLINYSSSGDAAQEVANQIPDGRGIPVQFDVSNPKSVEESITSLNKEHGPITILVNNAGVNVDGLIMRAKMDDFEKIMKTNLGGTFLVTKACTRAMMKAKGASIIQISSVVGEMGNAGQSLYSASKASLLGFTKSLAKELASRHIRVNAITPGFIETDMTDALTEEQKKTITDDIPLNAMGKPRDIAETVAFLASDRSRYITGQVIGVNGGLHM